uniref:Uncharacterized protein n=1 Tax=Populus trichocarpa TaxID=3694 RepID=A0A3N7GR17_POPTR
MQNSNIKEFLNQIKVRHMIVFQLHFLFFMIVFRSFSLLSLQLLNKMKIPSLSYSKNLVKTPNFHSSGLEKLILRSFLRNWIYQETYPLNTF